MTHRFNGIHRILLTIIVTVMSQTAFSQVQLEKMDYRKPGAYLPPFVLEKTSGGKMTNTDLERGKFVMLMLFSPQCGHCEHMIDTLKSWAPQFKETQLLLIAEDRNKSYMKDFIKKTGIENHPLFHNIGTVKGKLINYIYNYEILPQINFYNKQYHLIHTFSGNAPADSIKMFIR